jgi:hypothetical protein
MEAEDLNARLMRLVETLDRHRAPDSAAASPDTHPVVAHLESVRDERLRGLVAMMKTRIDDRDVDAEDALLLRLLLEEYANAVGHVRAAAQMIDERLSTARKTLHEGRRLAERARSKSATSDGN